MGFLTKSRGKKRKFKPPKLISQNSNSSSIANNTNTNSHQPPVKKQKISSNPSKNRFFQNNTHNNNTNNNNNNFQENLNPNTSNKPRPKKRTLFKKPRRNSAESPLEFAKNREEEANEAPRTWTVFHCKRSNKKHKNYIDGILRHDGKKLYLFDVDSAKQITTALWRKEFQQKIDKDEPIFFGSFQVEIDTIIDEKQYQSGQCFNQSILPLNTSNNNAINRSFKPIKINNNKRKQFKIPSKIDANGAKIDMKSQYNRKKSLKPITDFSKIKNPLVLNTAKLHKDYSPINNTEVAVCVASFLSDKLRPHQRIGTKYMYECIMGIKNGTHQCGMILADEMGLGKTLQTITLIYTIINEKIIKKCLIVTPSSLVGNWKKEFNKWISCNRKGKCGVIAMDEKKKSKRQNIITNFVQNSSNKNVLIIGYEMLRGHIDEIIAAQIGLIVCDEGHRLKNSKGNATITALNKIKCNKRILLTGTPIQNNLSELYAMCNWCNSLCLNDISHFKNTYWRPIEKSRDANATKLEKKLGDERSNALNKITTSFILRRTSEEILRKFLKPKDEYIIFHTLSAIQISLYQCILNNKSIKSIVNQKNIQKALQCLLYIRMCCSSPRLAYKKIISSTSLTINIPNRIRQQIYNDDAIKSEKFKVLINLLAQTKQAGDKIVIVSNFTSILDEVEKILHVRSYRFLRLDGSTTTQQRTKLVAQFNSVRSDSECFIFLLSAKAGGMGLNLIGGNRLVLLDPSWNPAIDQQAMARIWRDGQKKKCKIYRFITIGSIEEKILQRQIMKNEVADSVVDRNGKARHKHKDRHFTKDQLKEIFTLKTDVETCETMDILKENIKDWRVCSNCQLIGTIIPLDYDKQIPVIFQRSVDPKTDPNLTKWQIKQVECEDNENENNDNDNKQVEEEYRDSDMEFEDEYVLNYNDNHNHNDAHDIDEDEESDESDILIMKNDDVTNRSRFFDEDSDDDDDEQNKRPLQNKKADTDNGNVCMNNNNIYKEEEEIQKQIENITQQTQGNINDLNVNFTFDDFS